MKRPGLIDSPHRARKRFGQNFLVDRPTIARIVEIIAPKPGERIVEIGPGQAALTEGLLAALDAQMQTHDGLDVIEIDRDLVARLRVGFPPERVRVHEADALAFDFAALAAARGGPLRVVGNLPYNISTPILFHLLRFEPVIADMTFMLQKEVVERMAALPGDAARGRLSVMLQYRYRVERCFDVPPGAFRPIPAVDSSIVRLVPLGDARLRPRDEAHFAEIVSAAFSQRRKMIRRSLSGWIDAPRLRGLGIDPEARAETLSCAAFAAIADATWPADAP
ncbi:MAG: 16S rRNA (adenine(1518)-N(6)/adenine(1519)-N(6))-dimethyltransferase RsmA [Casimicrobiaceae bacterium]